MAGKKLSPEEELEKQYRDYKAQFEQWKEKNRESYGSEAYIKYVKQFQEWEKDVEKRRAAVRHKAEQERINQESEAKREAEVKQKQKEEAAAKAYAEEQSHYLSMHQRAMQEEQNARQSRLPKNHRPEQQQQHYAQSRTDSPAERIRQQLGGGTSQIKPEPQPAPEINSMATVMQQMLHFVMGAEKQQNGDSGDTHEGTTTASSLIPAGQPAHQEPTAPPQLWGNDGASYPQTDPMFSRWNVRAAPPNFKSPYQPPPQNIPSTPYWLMTQKMQEAKLVLAPQLNAQLVPPNLSSFAIPPPNINMPPPFFKV